MADLSKCIEIILGQDFWMAQQFLYLIQNGEVTLWLKGDCIMYMDTMANLTYLEIYFEAIQ